MKRMGDIFASYPKVVVAYLFGSRARGDDGPLSDYDFAVQFADGLQTDFFDLKLEIMAVLSDELKTDRVDLVVLNGLDKPELKFAIVYEGKLLFERGHGTLAVEPSALREYVDFRALLLRHGLTHAI